VVDQQVIKCYLNSDLLLGEFKDDTFKGGTVGLAEGALSSDGGMAIIDFDNFEFRRQPH
jgi:hypothetical protein